MHVIYILQKQRPGLENQTTCLAVVINVNKFLALMQIFNHSAIIIMSMGRTELTEEAKKTILKMSEDGHKHSHIAEKLGRNRSTITRFLKRLNERGTIENESRSGRPQKMNFHSKHTLRRVVQSDECQTLDNIVTSLNEQIPVAVSKRTVRRYLHKFGYKSKREGKKKRIPSECNVINQTRGTWLEATGIEHEKNSKTDNTLNSSPM